jgi:hypothetical protein
MIKMAPLLAILLLMSVVAFFGGCARQRIGVELYDPEVYTRSEVDAIQSEMQCKQTARTQIEVARCVGNRR